MNHPCTMLLAYPFRLFFVLAGVFAALVVSVWLVVLLGWLRLASGISPLLWHSHEMLYGFVPAAIAGFLLTAMANWTGTPPPSGIRLLALLLKGSTPALPMLAQSVWFHALGIGAMGTLIVGVMTRVAAAHTGRPLTLLRGAQPIYWLVIAAAMLRLAAALGAGPWTLYATGLAWCAAFALFTVRYAPILSQPRVDGQPG